MSALDDPFEMLVVEGTDEFVAPRQGTAHAIQPQRSRAAATASFYGFAQNDQPLVVGAPGLPHEILPAHSTVILRHTDIGSTVVLLFEDGDVRRPIVIGVVQGRHRTQESRQDPRPDVTIQADDDRFVVTAEREITLKCGLASITLTRAGKVIIRGTSIVSRASGHNKIKGAAVEIN